MELKSTPFFPSARHAERDGYFQATATKNSQPLRLTPPERSAMRRGYPDWFRL